MAFSGVPAQVPRNPRKGHFLGLSEAPRGRPGEVPRNPRFPKKSHFLAKFPKKWPSWAGPKVPYRPLLKRVKVQIVGLSSDRHTPETRFQKNRGIFRKSANFALFGHFGEFGHFGHFLASSGCSGSHPWRGQKVAISPPGAQTPEMASQTPLRPLQMASKVTPNWPLWAPIWAPFEGPARVLATYSELCGHMVTYMWSLGVANRTFSKVLFCIPL